MELINNNTNFKLTNLKFTKYHFMSGEIYDGCPIKTSIEIKVNDYNLQTNKDDATLCIVHTYFLGTEEQTNFQQYELENSGNIIKSLEQIDFKNLKNNYFSNDPLQRFSHWELEYNYYFKITGTFDNEIDEIKEVKKILNFEQIEKQELEKVDAKFKNTRFIISIKDAIENFMHKTETALDIENGLLNNTITFDIENENEFIKLTEGLKKLYNISNNELKFNNVEQMKQFLIDWLKKIEEVDKLADEEIEKYNTAVKNNLPIEDLATVWSKIKKLRNNPPEETSIKYVPKDKVKYLEGNLTEEEVEQLNKNSLLPINLLSDDIQILEMQGLSCFRNIMSYEYHCEDFLIKFYGYPTDEDIYRATEFHLYTDKYDFIGIKVGITNEDDVINTLLKYNFEIINDERYKNYNYDKIFKRQNCKVLVSFQNNIISQLEILMETKYLGNRLY